MPDVLTHWKNGDIHRYCGGLASGEDLCVCGHAIDWHSHDGSGDCEHDAKCNCAKFIASTTDASGVLQEEPTGPSVEAHPEPRTEPSVVPVPDTQKGEK